MTTKEINYEVNEIFTDLLTSLFYKDDWWERNDPLEAETFFNDTLDQETGIVYDCLDWFLLPEDERKDYVRGTLEELTPIFDKTRDLAIRMYKMREKYIELGCEDNDVISFKDWPVIGGYVFVGFRIEPEGQIQFLGHNEKLMRFIEEEVFCDGAEELEKIISFIEDSF